MMKQSLSGEWQVKRHNDYVVHKAIIPGSVYSALIQDGSMPDPYYR